MATDLAAEILPSKLDLNLSLQNPEDGRPELCLLFVDNHPGYPGGTFKYLARPVIGIPRCKVTILSAALCHPSSKVSHYVHLQFLPIPTGVKTRQRHHPFELQHRSVLFLKICPILCASLLALVLFSYLIPIGYGI